MLEKQLVPSTAPLLRAGTQFDVGVLPSALAAGDFNTDGKLDLATRNYVGVLLEFANPLERRLRFSLDVLPGVGRP
jgi:hypothetical protein